MTHDILVQIIGFIALGIGAFSLQFKEQKKLFAIWTVSDVIWVIHYIMLGALTPALTVSVAIIRTLLVVFIIPKAKTPVILLSLLTSTTLCVFAADGSLKDYLPILSAFVFATALYYHDNYKISRTCIGFGKLIWLVIGILFVSYAEILGSTIGLLSLLIGVYRHTRQPKLRPSIHSL